MFPDDTACTAFLTRLRWPQGFICPVCKTASTPWNECRGLVFRRPLEQAVATGPITEDDVTYGYDWGGN